MKRNLIIIASAFLVIISAIYYIKDTKPLKYFPVANEISIKEVYISGAITRPGHYRILESSELKDLIKVAGGTLVSADVSAINLKEKITKKEYHIAFYDEEGNGEGIKKVNLNLATIEQLKGIPGLAETLAGRIIEYRNEVKTIYAIEELQMYVTGIGANVLEKIRPYITV